MLSRSCTKFRRCTTYPIIYCKKYCSNLSKNTNEYEATFYSRPFGLDLKYNEFKDEITVSRAAWKDIQINSVLHKINGQPLKECVSNMEENEEEEIDDDQNIFKDTIKYLQQCPLPTKIVFKLNDSATDQTNESENNNTFSSLIAPFLELPNKSLYSMSNEEFVNYLQLNWNKQLKMYNKFNSNKVFKQKYVVFLSLMDILEKHIKNFNKIGEKLKTIRELDGKKLSNYTTNKDVIYKMIAGIGNVSDMPTVNAQQILINKIKNEIMSILNIINETNFEKIESKYLFDTLFNMLLFNQIVNITAAKHDINKEYLHENKAQILGKLSNLIPTLKSIETQVKICRIVNKYFESDYEFMNDNNDTANINKQSEYWFVVTLLNDILLFPIHNKTHSLVMNDTISSKAELNKYNYVLKVNEIEFHPHTLDAIKHVKSGEISIEYIPKTVQANLSQSLRDRFNYFESDIFEFETLEEYIKNTLNINENDNKLEIEQIDKYLKKLDLNNLSASGLDVVMEMIEVVGDEGEDNIENLEIYLDHLCIWIHSIVEILRVDYNKEHELYNYLTNIRPKQLIKNDMNKLKNATKHQFIEYISQKISEISNENNNECLGIVLTNKDGILLMLNSIEWDNEQIINANMNELMDEFIKINNEKNIFGNSYEIKHCIDWLYCILHNIERVNTPIFDTMIENRNSLKDSLLDDEYERDENNNICDEFIELKQDIDNKLYKESNPDWVQFSDEFEQEFVQKWLNGKGFADHSEKFVSMSCLSRLKNPQMKEMELCAMHRKRLMRDVNRWREIQNIIKYGEKPYYRSNGIDRTSFPSKNQSFGETGCMTKHDKFDPKVDQTKATKMFYAPFVNYPELYQFVRHRRFDPNNPLQSLKTD